MLSLSFFIALLFISPSLQQPATPPSLVIELFRHGARAPLEDTYAMDWPAYELGQLTSVGMREHYLLGRALANNYPEILGQPYNLSKIYVRSSVLTRSMNSATSQLYGVYEGNGPALNADPNYPSERAFPPFNQESIQQINQGLNNSQAIPGGFVPIALNTTSDERGVTLLEPTQVCFNLVNDILENVLSDEAANFWEDLEPTRQALEDMGIDVGNPYSLGTFGDALVCDYYDGRPLPGGLDPTSQLYKNVTFARNWYFVRALWGTEAQRQLLSVPLFYYILDYFDAKIAGTTNFEFMFLSTAETNLIDILATFNILTEVCLMENYQADLAGQPVPNPNCNYTEFASNIVIELYMNNGSNSVVFKYNDVAIPLCNGQVECSYDDFKNLVVQSTNGDTPDKYQRDCLGRTLPDLQKLLKQLGTAFEAAHGSGGNNQDLVDNLWGSISEALDDDNNDNNDQNDDDDHSFSSIFDNAIDNIKDHLPGN